MAADPEVKPLREDAGRPKADEANGVVHTISKGSTNTDYLVRRLKRDAPEIAEALARGEYPSARAAGIAAGIVRVPTTLDLLRRDWAKATPEERQQFLSEIKETP